MQKAWLRNEPVFLFQTGKVRDRFRLRHENQVMSRPEDQTLL